MTMPAPVADERAGLREFLTTQQHAFHVVAVDLADEQARSTPSVSELSLGGLIKHLTQVQRMWTSRVTSAPELTAGDQRPVDEQAAEFGSGFVMGDDDTLTDVLTAFADSSAEAVRLLETADLDTVVPIPPGCRGFRRTGLPGRCAMCISSSSRSSPVMPDTPTSFAKA